MNEGRNANKPQRRWSRASPPNHRNNPSTERPPLNGDARSLARSRLAEIAKLLGETPLAPPGTFEESLRHAMPFVEEMVETRLVERPDAADAIWQACADSGFVAEQGEDAVQTIIADCRRKREDDALAGRHTNGASGGLTRQAQPRKSTKKPTQADILIEIATGPDVEFYHTPDGKAFADIPVDGHRETWSLKNSAFRHWLKREFYQRTGGAPNSDAMSMAMGVIEAMAHYDGAEHEVYLRVANCGDQIYLGRLAPWEPPKILPARHISCDREPSKDGMRLRLGLRCAGT